MSGIDGAVIRQSVTVDAEPDLVWHAWSERTG